MFAIKLNNNYPGLCMASPSWVTCFCRKIHFLLPLLHLSSIEISKRSYASIIVEALLLRLKAISLSQPANGMAGGMFTLSPAFPAAWIAF